jgi:hypothetical protein
MALFGHEKSLAEILKLLPEEELTSIARETKVDYYTKALDGKLMFNMLLYAILTISKLGQRGLADVYASPFFRILFNYTTEKRTISHSSLSDRLSVINIDFFKQVYYLIYKKYSGLYATDSICGLNLQRVDSTLVAETSNKLKEGMTCGNEYKRKKMLKYTMNYDGMFGSCCKTHTDEKYACESLALPENVLDHFKKSKGHATVYIFDRGQSSAEAFKTMKKQNGLLFVGRLLENRKLHVIKEFDLPFNKRFEYGELKQDAIVQLYKMEQTVKKDGQPGSRKQVLVDETFRIIRFRPEGKDEDIILITNILYLHAELIAEMYRRRWDIEVFFRFLKQELNFSHFLSLNENGIQVVMYMTLIVAMLVMIYKKINNIGYKTAVRRMGMEMEGIISAIIVTLTGGDLSKAKFLSDP